MPRGFHIFVLFAAAKVTSPWRYNQRLIRCLVTVGYHVANEVVFATNKKGVISASMRFLHENVENVEVPLA